MTQIKVRRGTASQWTAANPTLAAGEPGFETDTGKIKFGDGSTAWVSLAYLAGEGGGGGVTDHGALTGLADNDHTQYALLTDLPDPELLENAANASVMLSGQQILDTTGMSGTVLVENVPALLRIHPVNAITLNVEIDAATPNGRTVLVNVDQDHWKITWHSSIVVESWTTDDQAEVWATLVVMDGAWHLVGPASGYDRPLDNIASGQAAEKITSGSDNIALGHYAGNELTSGLQNVYLGNSAGYSTATGSYNVAVGAGSGVLWTEEQLNGTVALGRWSEIATDYSIALGYNSTVATGHTDAVAIGKDTTTTGSAQVNIGPRDLELTDAAKGVVLKSPDGSRWRVTVNDAGSLVVTEI